MIFTFFATIYFILYRTLKLLSVSLFMLVKAGIIRIYGNNSDALPLIFRRYFEILGGGFIKIGQTLSMRYDILPVAYCHELSNLLDKVKPFPEKQGIQIIQKQWKGKLHEIIPDGKLELVASASLAQVYKMTNKDGEQMAVKIKRPYITPILLADIFYLKLLNFIIFLAGFGTKLGLNEVMKELITALKSELNYKKEVLVMDTFYALSKEDNRYRTPKVYNDYCTNSLICMEYLEGIWISEILTHIRKDTLDEFMRSRNITVSLSDLSKKIFEILMSQIYDDSFFHADPHAGNIILLPEGQIGFVDFGITGVFSKEDKQKQLDYLLALSIGDVDLAIDRFVDILEPTRRSNYTQIKQEFSIYLLRWIHANHSESERKLEKTSGFLIMKSIALVKKHRFKFPKNIMLYYKSVFILENVIFELYPPFDTVAQTANFIQGNINRSIQKKISNEITLYRQYSLIENFLDLDRSIIDFLKSNKSTRPAWSNRGYTAQILRIFILIIIILLALHLLPINDDGGLIAAINGIGIGWLLGAVIVLLTFVRKYIT